MHDVVAMTQEMRHEFVPAGHFPERCRGCIMEWNGRASIDGDGPAAREGRVNGVTIRQFRCPRCGHVADIPRSAEDDPDAVIESLHREIRQLRETVACLRGSLGWQATPQGSSRGSTR
jgi:hypothetical protein